MKAGVPSAGVARSAGLLLLFLVLAAGACAGIVFWAWQGSIFGVALSALLPGSCAASVLPVGIRRLHPDVR